MHAQWHKKWWQLVLSSWQSQEKSGDRRCLLSSSSPCKKSLPIISLPQSECTLSSVCISVPIQKLGTSGCMHACCKRLLRNNIVEQQIFTQNCLRLKEDLMKTKLSPSVSLGCLQNAESIFSSLSASSHGLQHSCTGKETCQRATEREGKKTFLFYLHVLINLLLFTKICFQWYILTLT